MKKSGERQRKWREANQERAKEYKRDYLRLKWLPDFLAEHGYPGYNTALAARPVQESNTP